MVMEVVYKNCFNCKYSYDGWLCGLCDELVDENCCCGMFSPRKVTYD